MDTRVCSICGEQSIENFSKDKGGHQRYCKKCKAQYIASRREKINEAAREAYAKADKHYYNDNYKFILEKIKFRRSKECRKIMATAICEDCLSAEKLGAWFINKKLPLNTKKENYIILCKSCGNRRKREGSDSV
jgi:phosphoglucomutase